MNTLTWKSSLPERIQCLLQMNLTVLTGKVEASRVRMQVYLFGGYIGLVVVKGEGAGVEAEDCPGVGLVEVDGLDSG